MTMKTLLATLMFITSAMIHAADVSHRTLTSPDGQLVIKESKYVENQYSYYSYSYKSKTQSGVMRGMNAPEFSKSDNVYNNIVFDRWEGKNTAIFDITCGGPCAGQVFLTPNKPPYAETNFD